MADMMKSTNMSVLILRHSTNELRAHRQSCGRTNSIFLIGLLRRSPFEPPIVEYLKSLRRERVLQKTTLSTSGMESFPTLLIHELRSMAPRPPRRATAVSVSPIMSRPLLIRERRMLSTVSGMLHVASLAVYLGAFAV